MRFAGQRSCRLGHSPNGGKRRTRRHHLQRLRAERRDCLPGSSIYFILASSGRSHNILSTKPDWLIAGKLCTLSTSNGATRRSVYDVHGRSYQTATDIVNPTTGAGEHFDSFSLYDALGRPRITAYPLSDPAKNPLQLVQDYYGAGFVSTVTEREPVTLASTVHWSAPSRYNDGQIYRSTIGTLQSSRGYDTVGRVASVGVGLRARSGTRHLREAIQGIEGKALGRSKHNQIRSSRRCLKTSLDPARSLVRGVLGMVRSIPISEIRPLR